MNHATAILIDTKMYVLHVERHVRGVVTELSVRKGNTNNKPRMFLEDFESLSLPLQESVEKTKIRLNIKLLGYVSCLNTIYPWLKSIVEHGNDCWKTLTLLLKQTTASYIHLSHLFVSYEVFWWLWMRFQLSEAIFRHGKILLKKFNIFQFHNFRFRYCPVMSEHSPEPTVQIWWK